MDIVVVFLVIFFVLLLVGGPIALLQIQRVLREQKDYERGLKMTALFIHLPPPSEDIDVGSRDVRDVVEENISKAQTLYSILASTFKKGFKSRVYGQRHIGLEIVGTKGLVHFYATVPVALIDVVKQAIVSAYPAARLEEVPEENIFSPIGKISGTIGGELSLKEPFAYPIANYQEIKRDAMQSVLNALSTLEKEDGAGIQILLRPANPNWRKTAAALVSQKKKGESSGKPIGQSAVSFLNTIAGSKASESKGSSESPQEKMSNLDKSVLDSIEDKMRYPGFEVLIRVIASSNINQRAETLVNNICASFALFDSPGKNGFKYTVAKDIERFITAYILRFFPPDNNKNILNSVELASLFHFPDRMNTPTSQLERQESKQVDGPRNIPEEGIMLGYNLFRGVKKAIRLSVNDRRLHIYVVGQTGTGKSTFLENLALQDMLSGRGFAFVDPHGDTADRLLSMIPKERTEDVIYFSPAEMDYPMGLNLFEFHNADQKDFLIQESLNMLYKLYDPQHSGIMGPRYEHLFRNAALTVMADPAGGTFIDIPKLFRDSKFVQQKLQYVSDQTVIDFWQKEVPQSQRSNDFGEVTGWFVSKFGAFLSNEMMRNIIGQTKSAFDLRQVMDEGKILLVNLSKGRTGELNSKLLGMIFVMKFQAAAMSRANIPEDQRRDFSLYVDEFQNFSTDSFATMMSEARKYRLNLIVANQFTTQLSDEVRDAVFGNIGTTVAFRVGQNDVDVLSRYFQPLFDGEDLLRIPNHNTIVRTMVNGVPTQPFSMATLPPIGDPNSELAKAIKQLSAAKYGLPRKQVEAEIFDRLATKELPRSTYPGSAGGSLASGMPPAGYTSPAQGLGSPANPMSGGLTPADSKPPIPSTGSSFLDEWLKKRQPGQPSTPSAPPTAQAAPRPFDNQAPTFNQPPVTQPTPNPSFNQVPDPMPPLTQTPPIQPSFSPPTAPPPSNIPSPSINQFDPFAASASEPPRPSQNLNPTQAYTTPDPFKNASIPNPSPQDYAQADQEANFSNDSGELKIERNKPAGAPVSTEQTIYIDPAGNINSGTSSDDNFSGRSS